MWTVLAAVLTVCAVAMCLLNVLDTPRLTALANKAANRALDAEVTLGRVELSLMRHLPFLRVDVDSVTIISGPMKRLDDADRSRLPEWSDTLLTLDHFHGGVNVASLLLNRIELHDVVFDGPGINIVTLNDSVSNYLIYASEAETEPDESTGIPDISINRFHIDNPRPLRYHNAQTDDHFDVTLETMTLDGSDSPSYSLRMGGDFDTPALALYNLDGLAFGLDGGIAWDASRPGELALRDFKLTADFLEAKVNAHVDFGRNITVRDYDLQSGRMGVERIVGLLPDSLQRAWGLSPDMFNTDLAITFSARSTGEFNLTDDSIPQVDMVLDIMPGSLRYGKARLDKVGGALAASLRGNDLGKASFSVKNLMISGPATDLTLDATVSYINTDPLVKGTLRGHTELRRLPVQVADMLHGFISGRVDADFSFEARPSMFTRNGFHRLRLDGDVDAHNLYYLSNDTVNMVYVREACFRLGTNSKLTRRDGAMADSLLTASLTVDSAAILHSNISMHVTDFRIGAGASNRHASADTTAVIPMGGGVDIGSFRLVALGDSAVFNVREAHGRVAMSRYRGEARRPQFSLDLNVGRMAAGTTDTRFMLMGSEVHARAHKLPRPPMPPQIKATADSIHEQHPELPMDSVYRYAIQRHRRHRGGRPRVHLEYTELEAEIINWGTSKTLRKLLLGWALEGNVKARRAGLFTPYFPIRNRVRDFNIRFNNDSVVLTDVLYKAGHSDFTISGRISNLKRGFTSKGFRSPLKINFEVRSDTIDVNELASSTFRGSAYAADTTHHRRHDFNLDAMEKAEAESDASFEREMGRYVADAPDSMAPLMIPRNIDLQLDINARNVLYSDLMFHDFSGQLLAYRGAINLHHLTAKSQVGRVNLSALYSASSADDLKFGFGMQVDDFNIDRFTRLVPALDTIMPLLHDFKGTINADIAATCDLDREMNFELPTLTAAIRLDGDSLALIDKETYRKIGRWLLFKDKQSNIIDHMNVEMTIRDNRMQLYPFMFDIDRYKLGVQGYNDLALNFDYHIAVLKSPLPFKFGINLKGNPDDFKVRLGRARFNEKSVGQTVSIVDTARVNLLNQIENIFRRGVAHSRFAKLNISAPSQAASIDLSADTISRADSLIFIKEGLIPAPPAPEAAPQQKGKKDKRKKKQDTSAVPAALKPDEPHVSERT